MASSPSEVTPGVIQFTNLQPLQETLHQVIQDTTTDFLTITGIDYTQPVVGTPRTACAPSTYPPTRRIMSIY